MFWVVIVLLTCTNHTSVSVGQKGESFTLTAVAATEAMPFRLKSRQRQKHHLMLIDGFSAI